MRTKETTKTYDDARGLGPAEFEDGAGKLDVQRGSRPRVRIRGAGPRLFRSGTRPLRFGRL